MAATAPTTSITQDSKRMQAELNEEYHDPHDDWSSRDIVLALTPLIITYALQDAAFRPGLLLALCFSAFLLLMRTITWDSRRKKVWPVLDLTSVFLFAILYGLSFVNYWQVSKWYPVIAPATFAFVTLLTLIWRRPWTAHYARYPKFDRGGGLLWRRDGTWRRNNDLSTIAWFTAFSAATLLALAATMTGYHTGAQALNVLFAYIAPLLFYWAALLATQILGSLYRSKTIRDLDRYYGRHYQQPGYASGVTAGTGAAGETYPAGAASTGAGQV